MQKADDPCPAYIYIYAQRGIWQVGNSRAGIGENSSPEWPSLPSLPILPNCAERTRLRCPETDDASCGRVCGAACVVTTRGRCAWVHGCRARKCEGGAALPFRAMEMAVLQSRCGVWVCGCTAQPRQFANRPIARCALGIARCGRVVHRAPGAGESRGNRAAVAVAVAHANCTRTNCPRAINRFVAPRGGPCGCVGVVHNDIVHNDIVHNDPVHNDIVHSDIAHPRGLPDSAVAAQSGRPDLKRAHTRTRLDGAAHAHAPTAPHRKFFTLTPQTPGQPVVDTAPTRLVYTMPHAAGVHAPCMCVCIYTHTHYRVHFAIYTGASRRC